MAPSLIGLVNTERLQSSIFAPFRLAGLANVTHFTARLKFEAAANGGLIFSGNPVWTASLLFFKLKIIAPTLCR